jgi:hypothetical protein
VRLAPLPASGGGGCTEGVVNPFSLRLDFLVRKSVYAAHRGRWSRLPSSQLDRVDLLGGAAPARSQVTTFAEAALFWIKEGRTGSEERFAFATRSAATN